MSQRSRFQVLLQKFYREFVRKLSIEFAKNFDELITFGYMQYVVPQNISLIIDGGNSETLSKITFEVPLNFVRD